MTGKNHLIVNTCTAVSLSIGSVLFVEHLETNFFSSLQIMVSKLHNHMFDNLSIVILVLCFYVGTLLPDCDSPNSLLGRWFHIPVKHRTWTHAIWVPLILIISSFWFHYLAWIAFGYFLHLFWDSLSVGGVCFFYPFSKYNTYSSGAQVKRNHRLKCYRVDSLSETITMIIVCLFTVFLIVSFFLKF